MRVAVTGGTGFIGEALVQRLIESGHSVRVLSRNPGSFRGVGVGVYQADLADPSHDLVPFVDGVDAVFHCAGQLSDESRMRVVHVDGTARLLRASAGRVGQWIHLSSVGAYGPIREGTVDETWPTRPSGEYERTKTESDELVRASTLSGVSSILRPANVYGPRMRNRSLLQLIGALHRGVFFYIGPRGATANYVHVDDVVDAMLACSVNPGVVGGKTYILSTPSTLEAVVGAICDALGRTPPSLRIPTTVARALSLPALVTRRWPLTSSRIQALTGRAVYSSDLLRRELGLGSSVSLSDGMAEMVRAWRGTAAT